jgi:hypothetical protein
LLSVPVFQRIYERFVGKAVPADIIDKLLIREFEVPEAMAARVGDYFLEGARICRLITDNGTLLDDKGVASASSGTTPGATDAEPIRTSQPDVAMPQHYVVKVAGPGISTSIDIFVEDDLAIVDAVLGRIRKAVKN